MIAKNLELAGRISKNGYEYTVESLQDAVHMYEGKPVFLNHDKDNINMHMLHKISNRNLAGWVVNTRFEDGSIRGDVQVLDTPSGYIFWSLFESKPDDVGMSHVVLAIRDSSGLKVINIKEVISIDVVRCPATTFNLATTP